MDISSAILDPEPGCISFTVEPYAVLMNETA